MKLKKFIKISPEDNTAVLLFDMGAGEKIAVDEEEITALDPIKYGHKIALSDISESEPILKYGEIIGPVQLCRQTGFIHGEKYDRRRSLIWQMSDRPGRRTA